MKEYVFAYGSLLNKGSRERTFHTASVYKAYIKSNSGYLRTFNFRSKTGFTALGLTKSDNNKCKSIINGLIIEVENSQGFQQLDSREIGYNRIDITEYVEVIFNQNDDNNDDNTDNNDVNKKIWVYVPSVNNAKLADQEFPICQTYVDTVLEGCLELGEKFMEEWILSTEGWSKYYLYDTPTSRRP